MKIKSLAILLSACLTANAETYLHQFDEINFYGRGSLGTGWADKTKKKFSGTGFSLDVEYHPTTTFSFAGGYRHEHWRTEAEYAYFKNTHKKFSLSGTHLEESGAITIHAGMLNLLYDFADEYYATIPYFGAGIGTSNISIGGYKHLTGLNLSGSESENEFAWQGMLGIGYYFDKHSMLDFNYRHFATTQAKRTIDSEYHTNTLNINYTYHFM